MALKVNAPQSARINNKPSSTFLARRVLAGMVDLTLVVATALPFAQGEQADGLGSLVNTATILAIAVTASVVGLIVPTLTGGRTPGKLLFGLSTSLEDGGRPSIKHHALRTAAAVADLMPGVVPGLTGFAVAASSPRRQRLGDRLAGTTVIDLTVAESSDSADSVPLDSHPLDSDSLDSHFLNPDPADNPFLNSGTAADDLLNGDFADNELNQPPESADNPDTRPEFPAAVSSSEVVNVNSADDSTPDTLNSEQEPEQETAAETVEKAVGENIDREPDPEWAEGPISTFSVAELAEAATETVTLHVGPSAEAPDANQGLKDEGRADSTSAEDEASVQTMPADTTKSRLVESASAGQSPSAAAYPLPSHRRATSPEVEASDEAVEVPAQEPQELQPIGEVQPVEEPSTQEPSVNGPTLNTPSAEDPPLDEPPIEESRTDEGLTQASLAEVVSGQEETSEQEAVAETAPEPLEDQQAEAETVEAETVETETGETETVEAGSADEVHNAEVPAAETAETAGTDETVEQPAAVAEADAEDSQEVSQSAQDGEADPAVPVWSEDWNAWICWNDAEQAWLRYDSAIGEWLSMEAAVAEL